MFAAISEVSTRGISAIKIVAAWANNGLLQLVPAARSVLGGDAKGGKLWLIRPLALPPQRASDNQYNDRDLPFIITPIKVDSFFFPVCLILITPALLAHWRCSLFLTQAVKFPQSQQKSRTRRRTRHRDLQSRLRRARWTL